MTLLSKSGSWLNVVNISWAMFMQSCFCSKFSNFETIFAVARFMSKTSLKIAWHEPKNMATPSATSLIGIGRLSKNFRTIFPDARFLPKTFQLVFDSSNDNDDKQKMTNFFSANFSELSNVFSSFFWGKPLWNQKLLLLTARCSCHTPFPTFSCLPFFHKVFWN